MVPADSAGGVLDGAPYGCGGAVPEEVGQRGREDGNLVEEAEQCQIPCGRAKGVDPVFDAGGAGAVEDEQQPWEERVMPPQLLHRRFWRVARRPGGHIGVESGIGGQLGAEPFRAHDGAVDFHERPQHRSAVTSDRAVLVVEEGAGMMASPLPIGWWTSVIQSGGRHRSPRRRVLEEREPGLGHRQGVADLEAYGGRIGCRPGGSAPAQLGPLAGEPRTVGGGEPACVRPAAA